MERQKARLACKRSRFVWLFY